MKVIIIVIIEDEMEFIDVMERVALVVEKDLGMKPTDMLIAKYLDISATNFSNMKKRNSIPWEKIAYFSANHKISANWILFAQHCESLLVHEEKFYSLRVINKINASCGGGSFEDEDISIGYVNLEKDVLSKLGYSNINNFDAIKIVGDSMFPILKENELVLVNKASINYDSESIFLVNTTSGLFIKRLKIYEDNKIDLISDNENYSNVTFCVDEVTIIGKVLGVLELNEEDKKVEDKKVADSDEVKNKIEIGRSYIELIDNEYTFFIPNEDLTYGYDQYSDKPLYDLERNQFYAITIDCKTYDELIANKTLEIESSDCILIPAKYEKEDDIYAFLFEDYNSYSYEYEKLVNLYN